MKRFSIKNKNRNYLASLPILVITPFIVWPCFAGNLQVARGDAVWVPKHIPTEQNDSQNKRNQSESRRVERSSNQNNNRAWDSWKKPQYNYKQQPGNYRHRNESSKSLDTNSQYREDRHQKPEPPRTNKRIILTNPDKKTITIRREIEKDSRRYNDRYNIEPRHNDHRIIEKRVVVEHRHKHRPRYDIYQPNRYIYYRTPWYNTRYIAPISQPFFKIGYRVNVLPRSYIEFFIGGTPYFYNSGSYYKRNLTGGYVVVSAPYGAVVKSLPVGFIAFSLGLATYYYVNDTYYAWDEPRSAYVVVERPIGATEAISSQTMGRLFAYPNNQQSEEQQAKDRYECHQWAVSETGHDPSLETDELTEKDRQDYRRAISACLVGRDYSVK